MAEVTSFARRLTILCVCIPGCGNSAPAYTTDQADASVYAEVAQMARRRLEAPGRIHLHPYLAVATDSTGRLRAELTTFAYEPSAALEILQKNDTSIVLCTFDALGMCTGHYLVFSDIARAGDRDGAVVVRSIRGPGHARAMIVRLRWRRSGWVVAGAELLE